MRRLVIKGNGFSADKAAGSDVVLIGPYSCTIIAYLTSDTVVSAAQSWEQCAVIENSGQDSCWTRALVHTLFQAAETACM